MTNLIKKFARKQLYGSKKNSHPVINTLLHDCFEFLKLVWNDNSKTDFQTWNMIQERLGNTFTPKTVPDNVEGAPQNIVDCLNRTLGQFGGFEGKLQKFYCQKTGHYDNFLYWSIRIAKLDTVKVDELYRLESEIENSLYDCIGEETNIRIKNSPLRIEIDKPNVGIVSFLDWVDEIQKLPVNEKVTAIGINGNGILSRKLTNHEFAALVTSRPGFGKGITAVSMVLSFAILNSPENINIKIFDPKMLDFEPLEKLRHVSTLTDKEHELVQITDELVEYMESNRNTEYRKSGYLLVIDELQDVFSKLKLTSPDMAKRLEINLQRLGQRGRASGISIIVLSQRAYELPVSVRSQFELIIAGKQTNNSDAFGAIGEKGTDLTKLGVGEFEVYPGAERIKTFYIADTDDKNYRKRIGSIVDIINNLWENKDISDKEKNLEYLRMNSKQKAHDTMFSSFPINNVPNDYILDQILINQVKNVTGDFPLIEEFTVAILHNYIRSSRVLKQIGKEFNINITENMILDLLFLKIQSQSGFFQPLPQIPRINDNPVRVDRYGKTLGCSTNTPEFFPELDEYGRNLPGTLIDNRNQNVPVNEEKIPAKVTGSKKNKIAGILGKNYTEFISNICRELESEDLTSINQVQRILKRITSKTVSKNKCKEIYELYT